MFINNIFVKVLKSSWREKWKSARKLYGKSAIFHYSVFQTATVNVFGWSCPYLGELFLTSEKARENPSYALFAKALTVNFWKIIHGIEKIGKFFEVWAIFFSSAPVVKHSGLQKHGRHAMIIPWPWQKYGHDQSMMMAWWLCFLAWSPWFMAWS